MLVQRILNVRADCLLSLRHGVAGLTVTERVDSSISQNTANMTAPVGPLRPLRGSLHA